MSPSPDDLALYRRLVVENYCITASSALIFYDHAVTFVDEVQRIWKRKFTGATAIYLLTRYVATFERVTLMASLFLRTTEDKRCVPVLRLDDALTDISTFTTAIFACLRVYAIYGTNWRPATPLLIIALAVTIIAIYFQVKYTPIAFGSPLYGCGASFNLSDSVYIRLATSSHALNVASDTLLLILTWYKTLEIRRGSTASGIETPLATLILRDGTLYFLVIFSIEVFAIVCQQIGSNFPLFSVWTYFAQSITVIALSRFMLNLRDVYLSRTNAPAEYGFTFQEDHPDLRLVSHVVGNFGAPLDIETHAAATCSWDTRTTIAEVEDFGEGSEHIIVVPENPLSVGLLPALASGGMVEMHELLHGHG